MCTLCAHEHTRYTQGTQEVHTRYTQGGNLTLPDSKGELTFEGPVLIIPEAKRAIEMLRNQD